MDVKVGLDRKLSAKEADAFELWCWRRISRVPWTAGRSNQSILKEVKSLNHVQLFATLWTVAYQAAPSMGFSRQEYWSGFPKGSQLWIFIGRTDAEAPILWPPDARSWLIGKDPDAGKDRGQEENGATEDEIVGWPWVINSMIVSLSKFQETVKDREALYAAVHGIAKNQTWLSNWTTTQRSWVSCSKSHSYLVAEVELEPRSLCFWPPCCITSFCPFKCNRILK